MTWGPPGGCWDSCSLIHELALTSPQAGSLPSLAYAIPTSTFNQKNGSRDSTFLSCPFLPSLLFKIHPKNFLRNCFLQMCNEYWELCNPPYLPFWPSLLKNSELKLILIFRFPGRFGLICLLPFFYVFSDFPCEVLNMYIVYYKLSYIFFIGSSRDIK